MTESRLTGPTLEPVTWDARTFMLPLKLGVTANSAQKQRFIDLMTLQIDASPTSYTTKTNLLNSRVNYPMAKTSAIQYLEPMHNPGQSGDLPVTMDNTEAFTFSDVSPRDAAGGKVELGGGASINNQAILTVR